VCFAIGAIFDIPSKKNSNEPLIAVNIKTTQQISLTKNNQEMNKIEIPSSKTKLLFGIGGSILFVVLGLYLFTTIADQQTRFSPTLVKGVGIAGILFFGVAGIYGIMKILRT